jgi:peptide/nickel transport system substrate-binding protein
MLLSGVICLLGITSALAITYNEVPMLRTKVATGLLPPIEERLPLEPKILSAERNEVPKGYLDFEIGQYGGTLRSVRPAPDWNPDIFVMNNEPLLSAPGILAKGIKGNILKDFEVSEDGKILTFYMREGLKWSDGVPVTSEDVLFTYEDFLLNEKVTPTFPRWMRSANKADGEPLKLEVIDDYTFRISFAEPYEGFPAWLTIIGWKGYTELLKPKHYLKNFHIRYTPLEKLEPLIKEEELAKGEWWTLFNMEDILNWELTNRRAVGFPTLNPWMLVEVTPTVFTYERNPYYFKVDAEGNQLPYIDMVRDELVADVEMSTMKVLAGELDFLREDATLESLALYKESEEAGGYRVVLLDMHVTPVDISLSFTYPDPVWQKVVRDVRFRRALNMAINREEIIDAVYFGFAELPTAVPSVYDPQKANQLLDEMGLNKRDAEGYRLGPDGKTFVIPFEIAMHAADIVPVTELVVECWKKVGIKATMKTIDPGLWGTRKAVNELKATSMWTSLPVWHNFAHFFWGDTTIGPPWDLWYTTGGKEGEEPPAEVKRFLDLLYQSLAVSPEEVQKVRNEYLRLLYENVYFFNIVDKVKYSLIVSERLGNVQHKGFAITTNFAAEQLFFKP